MFPAEVNREAVTVAKLRVPAQRGVAELLEADEKRLVHLRRVHVQLLRFNFADVTENGQHLNLLLVDHATGCPDVDLVSGNFQFFPGLAQRGLLEAAVVLVVHAAGKRDLAAVRVHLGRSEGVQESKLATVDAQRHQN